MLHGRMLRYLDEVARCGSIRKAAARLNVASSAINRQILTLEAEIGAPLFERLPRKLVLTAAGEVLVGHARQTLRGMERAQAQIAELKGLRRGEVSLAVMSGLAGNLLLSGIAVFRRTHPRVRLRVQLLSGPEILAAVAQGEADLGLGFDLPGEPGLRPLAEVPVQLGAVMNPSHPLASRAALRLSDLVGHPLVVADRGMAIRPHLDAAFDRAGLTLDLALETNSIEVMRRAAELEDCVTFLTPFDMQAERRAGRLVHVPIAGGGLLRQTLALIGRSKGLSPVAASMGEVLKGLMREDP